MNIFKNLIKCRLCGKNYNYKNDHGTKYYICSGYKNYGTNYCKRYQLKIEDLLYMIRKHCDIHNKDIELTYQFMKELIDRIEVYGEEEINIFWNDGKITKFNNNQIVF